jgi:UDP-3-O-[3-hydroxymyristoyl] glucosamine N-acyltransferase
MPEFRARSLAQHVGGELVGDGEFVIRGVAPLESADPGDLSIVANRKYLRYLGDTRATAVLVSQDLARELPDTLTRICVPDVHAALGEIILLLHPPVLPVPGIHPTAILGEDVEIGDSVSIGPYTVVGRGTRLGERVAIGAHVVVGESCRVGADTLLHPHVTLYPRTEVGDRCVVHSGVRLGSDGFGYVWTGGEHRKVPQVGGCRIEDDVEIGANGTIDGGSIGPTVVGQGTKIDNLVQLGHNVRVGNHVLIVAQAGVAGSTSIGDGAVLGGQAGIGGHLRIGPRARVGAQAGVTGDVAAGETVSGYPARPHREAMRAQAALFRLPALLRRILRIERAVFGSEQAAESVLE